MDWQGQELRNPADYVTALSAITTPEEARAFRDAWDGPEPERNIGYLTGYMTRPQGARVRELFGVDHPVIGDLEDPITERDLFELGGAFMQAQQRGLEFDDAAAEARTHVRLLRALGRTHSEGFEEV